jgi:uncharacterized membrane protein YedE/YeeE
MENTTLLAPIAGGALIGVAAAGLMLLAGRIAGISGIFSGLLAPKPGEIGWRVSFVAGLVVGGALLFVAMPSLFATELPRSLPAVALGGLLVGFGARLGSGCTSGHGVCGIARRGPRSVVATITFISTGALSTFVVNHLLGGAI